MSEYIPVPIEATRAARRAKLYDFLLRHHYNDVKKEGNSLRLRNNNSVSVKAGYTGYTDFATGEKGNSIKFLMEYLGYSFPEAVAALCADMGVDATGTKDRPAEPAAVPAKKAPQEPPQDARKPFILPEPEKGPYRQLFAYLGRQRCIQAGIVQRLIDWGLLYQEAGHANMVFINPEMTFAELRGTNSFKPFHQVMFSDPAAFWWFKPHGPDSVATVAYICEGAIDAVSLFLLREAGKTALEDIENALYCSIGGVANQQRIDCIKAGMGAAGCQTIIAVDNDKPGEDCRQRNRDCPSIIPDGKDWNEDLIYRDRL